MSMTVKEKNRIKSRTLQLVKNRLFQEYNLKLELCMMEIKEIERKLKNLQHQDLILSELQEQIFDLTTELTVWHAKKEAICDCSKSISDLTLGFNRI